MHRLVLLFALVLTACGGHGTGNIDDTVGAACTGDRQCADRCFLDGNDKFPGGFCSLTCVTDRDCPNDTYCVTAAGGVCLFACPAFNCSRLGAGYVCEVHDDTSGAKVSVCIGG